MKFDAIILEGPDNGGKSTLAPILVRETKGFYVSHLGGRTMTRDQMHTNSKNLVYRTHPGSPSSYLQGQAFVAERFHPVSDYVYRKIFGGERIFSDNEVKFYFNQLKKFNSPLLVYCRPPLDAAMSVEHRPAGDDDETWNRKVSLTMPALFRAYDEYMVRLVTEHSIPIIPYDWTCAWSVELVRSVACAD